MPACSLRLVLRENKKYDLDVNELKQYYCNVYGGISVSHYIPGIFFQMGKYTSAVRSAQKDFDQKLIFASCV